MAEYHQRNLIDRAKTYVCGSLAALALARGSGCAMTVKGTQQETGVSKPDLSGMVKIESLPPQAKILIDGRERGETPLVYMQVGAGMHKVVIEKKGYLPYETNLITRILSSDVFGGKIFTTTPNQVHVKLEKPVRRDDVMKFLKELKNSRDSGAITDAEYEKIRRGLVEKLE